MSDDYTTSAPALLGDLPDLRKHPLREVLAMKGGFMLLEGLLKLKAEVDMYKKRAEEAEAQLAALEWALQCEQGEDEMG